MLREEGDQVRIVLTPVERDWLILMLAKYPVAPRSFRRLSHTIDGDRLGEDTALLEEALAERKQTNKGLIAGILKDLKQQRRKPDAPSLLLDLRRVDWLLEVLNDVRVGSWVRLGSPELARMEKGRGDTKLRFAMDVAGYFQQELLSALEQWGM